MEIASGTDHLSLILVMKLNIVMIIIRTIALLRRTKIDLDDDLNMSVCGKGMNMYHKHKRGMKR